VGLALWFNPTTYRWPIHLSRTSIFHSIHSQFYFVGTHWNERKTNQLSKQTNRI
jgi:hypothetical protein